MEYFEKYMKRAINLAKHGEGKVAPNPLVGAVIVKNKKIIGEGWHEKYGGDHAEIMALKNALEDVAGADLYVNLEPCAHYGKTPPCAVEIVRRKIKNVYVGITDPNPLVAGKGINILKAGGVKVKSGVLKEECRTLNEVFLKYITTKKPYVVIKTAMTLDGKTAAHTGDSKWITGEESRLYVHTLRNKFTAIMVGINTVLTDDPRLTARIKNGRNPVKIIADSTLKTPENANVLNGGNCIIATVKPADKYKKNRLEKAGAKVIETESESGRVNLTDLMAILGKQGIDSILLEGGGTLSADALKEKIVDKIITFIAPKIVGGKTAFSPVCGKGADFMNDAVRLSNFKIRRFGEDVMLSAYTQNFAADKAKR